MSNKVPSVKDLFKAGAHFGHQRSKTDARVHDYVYAFQNRVAVIDLDITVKQLSDSLDFIADKASEGSTFLFVGTKIQSSKRIKEAAKTCKQPYVNERWPGGLITNYKVVSKSIKDMIKKEEGLEEGRYDHLTKNERLRIKQSLEKTRKIFDGLRDLDGLPDVLFVVDAQEEGIAIAEAKSKDIPVVAICDTDSNPSDVDYPIVANDESTQTLNIILGLVSDAISKNYKEKKAESSDVEERVEKALGSSKSKNKTETKKKKEEGGKDDGKN